MLIPLLFGLLLPVAPHAQGDRPAIAGTVTDSVSGEVLIGAQVMLAQTNEDSIPLVGRRGTTTNRYGFYSLPDVAPGRYLLSFRTLGYRTWSTPVSVVQEGADLTVDAGLVQEDIRLAEVVVEATAGRTLTPAPSAIEVNPDFIKQMPSLGGEVDLFRALQLLPGIKAESEISSGLYIRGGSPDQNLTLLDGVVLYNPSHLGGFLSVFNADALNGVRLIKGAFPAEYGGRLSSVIDVTMREGTKERVSGSAGVSLISSRLMLQGPLPGDASFMVSGRRMYLDLFYPFFDSSEEIPRYYFYDLNTKVNIGLSASDRFFASGYFGRDVLAFSQEEDNLSLDVGWGNATANLRWMHVFSPSLFTSLSAIYTNYDFATDVSEEHFTGQTEFSSTSRIEDVTLRYDAQIFPHETHALRAGAEITRHHFTVGANDDLVSSVESFVTRSELRSVEAAAYLQDEWTVTEQLVTNAGLRLGYFNDGRYLALEPRLSAVYALSDDWLIRGSYAIAHQYLHLLTRNDITLPTDLWFPSTPQVEPGRSVQWVLGVESTLPGGAYVATVEGYYKTMQNLYEYRDGADLSFGVPLESQFTSGSGEAYGIEVFLNKRVGDFSGWLGYTLAWTRRTFPELNSGRSFYPRYDRRHEVALVLTYRLGDRWEFGATWTYATGQAYTLATGLYLAPDITPNVSVHYTAVDYSERNGYRLPAFHKLDLNFTHRFSWFSLPFEFSINLYNAYNRRNPYSRYLNINESTPVLKQVSLFPILPTFGLSMKF